MTVQPAYLTLGSGTSRYLTLNDGTEYYLTLNDPSPYDNDVETLLAEAVWYIDAHQSTASQTVPNLGTGGTAIDARLGSGTGADSNDPVWLAYSAGVGNYLYLPGVAGNQVSVTAPALTANYLATYTDNTTATGAAAPGAFALSTVGAYKSIALRDSGNVALTTVTFANLTSPTQTTIAGSGSETWTISRSTSGRKTTLVGGWAGGGSLWLFGTDDYMEVPDDANLDFEASDSFTVLAVVRRPSFSGAFGSFISKMNTDTEADGWQMRRSSDSSGTFFPQVGDGTDEVTATQLTCTAGQLHVMGMLVDRGAATMRAVLDSALGTTISVSAVGDTSNALPVRVGRSAGGTGYYADMEFQAAAIWRRALTAGEVAGLSSYFANRAYNG